MAKLICLFSPQTRRSSFHNIHRLLSISSDESAAPSGQATPVLEKKETLVETDLWNSLATAIDVEEDAPNFSAFDTIGGGSALNLSLDNIEVDISDLIKDIEVEPKMEAKVEEAAISTDGKEIEVIFEGVRVECIDVDGSEPDTSSDEDEEDDEEEAAEGQPSNKIMELCEIERKEETIFKMPLKKRKRMRELQYPKSRFISINRNMIFDLTVEEEFRIHNINFRRFTEYSDFVKLMKESEFESSYENYKKNIFTSAFNFNRVSAIQQDKGT